MVCGYHNLKYLPQEIRFERFAFQVSLYNISPASGQTEATVRIFLFPGHCITVLQRHRLFCHCRLAYLKTRCGCRGGAASGVNNGISTYRCYYQYSDNSGGSWSGETGVDSGGAGYIDVNTASWPRGRLIRFHIPNTPTGMPTTNKSIYLPGGEFVAKVKIQYPDGPDYNSGQIIGTNASGSATSASVLTTDWIQRVLVNS